jgi:hypothetical protein
MTTIRPADRLHRLAILDAERAALRARLEAAYELDDDAEVDRVSDALAELVGRRDELVMAA